MSVVYVMWLRQLKRYWRSKPRIIGSLGQPMLFLLALGFGFGPIYERAGGGDYIQFLAPGIIAMSVLFTAVFSGIELIWDRQFGFLKETLAAPVPRMTIMLGKTLGGATVATGQGAVVFLLTLVVGFRPERWLMLPVALVFMFLTALLFTALGMSIASRMSDMHAFPLIMNFLVMPLFFLSGALFPLDGLPPAILTAARVDPFSYGVDALRGALVGSSHFGLGVDLVILSVVAAAFLLLGTVLFERVEI
ncbi:multidrug ABC transporter permease [Parcubacteria bacterium SG8_24]|nr:MAG: multidrug ABC transporter permease [Parcubacteria bacterium SG8_24]